jgi:cytochrome b561
MDRPTGWGLVSRLLHWLTAVLIALELALGFWIVDLSDYGPVSTAMVHHTLGFVLLALVIVRVNWRVNNVRPDHPASMGSWRRRLAGLTQALLYLLMIAFPLSGWAAMATSPEGLPIYFLGLEIPRMYDEPPATTFAYDLFRLVHELCWKVGLFVLATHLVGALLSEYRDGDAAITRMVRGPDDLG